MVKFNIYYLVPVPTRYVFVPCNVIGPLLHPKILITRDDNLDINGKSVKGFIIKGFIIRTIFNNCQKQFELCLS